MLGRRAIHELSNCCRIVRVHHFGMSRNDGESLSCSGMEAFSKLPRYKCLVLDCVVGSENVCLPVVQFDVNIRLIVSSNITANTRRHLTSSDVLLARII